MSQYYSLVTKAGFAAEANARSLGQLVKLTEFALGDSNDSEYDPTGDETSLKNERYRGVVNDIIFDPKYPDQFTVEGVVPQNVGGFTIREAAVYTDKGELYGIAKYPPSYKTTTGSGATSELKIRIIFGAANTNSIKLVVDPTAALATRDYVDDISVELHKQFNLPPAVHLFSANNFIESLRGPNLFEKGKIKFVRDCQVRAIDYYGDEVTLSANQPILDPECGYVEQEATTNLIANSNKMNDPTALDDGTTVEMDVGTLGSESYHRANFVANSNSRVYKTTPLASGAGKYTFAMKLWCNSGTQKVRLAGYDDSGYVVSSEIEINTTPQYYSFTFDISGSSNQYVGLFNGTYDGVNYKAQSVNFCNAMLTKGEVFYSYVPTGDSTESLLASSLKIDTYNNIPRGSFSIYVELNIGSFGRFSSSRVAHWDDENGTSQLDVVDDGELRLVIGNTIVADSANVRVIENKTNKILAIFDQETQQHKLFINGLNVTQNTKTQDSKPVLDGMIDFSSNIGLMKRKDFMIFHRVMSTQEAVWRTK